MPTPSAIPFWQRSRLLRIASAIPLRRNLMVMTSMFFASVAEGIGVATLLPLVAVLGDQSSKSNLISSAVLGTLDRLHLPHDPTLLLAIVGLGMVLKAGLMLFALGQVGEAVADVSLNLRIGLIEALIAARWGYYVRQPVGRFAGALGGEATRAGDAYNSLTLMFSVSAQALIYLLIAALASWKLALLSILVSAVMIGSLNRLLEMARRSAQMQGERLQSLLARLTDALVGIKPMKAMARHARFDTLFQNDLKAIRKAARKQVFARNANKALQEPILALCLAIGIFGALQLLHLPVGEVLIMSLLLAKFVSIVGKAQQELQNVNVMEASFLIARQAIDDTRASREQAHGGELPRFARELRFHDVCFAYDMKSVVRGANFSLRAGEIVTLTGPSGAGKTTLVDLLLGLHEPQAGDVLIDGLSLTRVDLIRWRSMTGYVPQELMLFNDSVLMNVTLGEPQFSREDVEHALRQAGAWDFVAALPEGIDSVVGERGGALSGGQRQRIAIARALVHRPRLLILDEATSALDPGSERLIVDNVTRLARADGLTVLSISHHPAWVEVADRVIRLEDGRATETLPVPPARTATA